MITRDDFIIEEFEHGGWAVRRLGSKRASRVVDHRSEAVRWASERVGRGKVYIKEPDCTYREATSADALPGEKEKGMWTRTDVDYWRDENYPAPPPASDLGQAANGFEVFAIVALRRLRDNDPRLWADALRAISRESSMVGYGMPEELAQLVATTAGTRRGTIDACDKWLTAAMSHLRHNAPRLWLPIMRIVGDTAQSIGAEMPGDVIQLLSDIEATLPSAGRIAQQS